MSRRKRKREDTIGGLLQEAHLADTQPRKRRPHKSRWFLRLLWPVVLLMAMVLAVGAWGILYQPEMFGMGLTGDLTATARSIRLTEYALATTALSNQEYALANEGTRIALEGWQRQLDRDATQVALDSFATHTAAAVANIQQATQAALNYEVTRSAFNHAATQVELDYQATRSALSQEATAIALGVPTETPVAHNLVTPTPVPAPPGDSLLDSDFSGGLDSRLWEFASLDDWLVNDDGMLVARRDGAWLLTRFSDYNSYSLAVELLPLVGAGLAADYLVLLAVPDSPDALDGITLRLAYDGERLTAVELLRFSRGQLMGSPGLAAADLEAIHAAQVTTPPDTALEVRVEVRADRIVVLVNRLTVLDVALSELVSPGAIGLQVPGGTRVRRITLYP